MRVHTIGRHALENSVLDSSVVAMLDCPATTWNAKIDCTNQLSTVSTSSTTSDRILVCSDLAWSHNLHRSSFARVGVKPGQSQPPNKQCPLTETRCRQPPSSDPSRDCGCSEQGGSDCDTETAKATPGAGEKADSSLRHAADVEPAAGGTSCDRAESSCLCSESF